MGKKIAVLVGINYIGTKNELFGCQNDIINFKSVLINNLGYKEKDIKMLMDMKDYEYPTKKNILNSMNWIVQQSLTKNSIDEIFFYFSGHGSSIIDKNKDETDGFDECIVPLDFQSSGYIIDDYIYSDFLSKIKFVNKITCVFDSCNSASCTDLPFSYTSINNTLVKRFYSKRPSILNNSKIFIISGCFDSSYSYDSAEPNGKPCGLLSYGLRKVLEKYNYNCTVENLITEIKKGFGNNNQTPVLSVNLNNIMPSTMVFDNKPVKTKISDKLIKTQTKKIKKSKIQNFNFFMIIQNLLNKFL